MRALAGETPGAASAPRDRPRDRPRSLAAHPRRRRSTTSDGAIDFVVWVGEDVTAVKRQEVRERLLSNASKLLSSSLDVDATIDKAAWAVVPELADWARDRPARRARRAGADGGRAIATWSASSCCTSGAATSRRRRGRRPRAGRGHAHREVDRLGRRRSRGRGPLRPVAAPRRADADHRHALDADRPDGRRRPRDRDDAARDDVRERAASSARADLELAEELARRAAIAVDHARVHAIRTHIATTLQRSLLPPRLPVIPGLAIAARFRAAGTATEVGGDFYDLFEARERWMVMMGDVTGKGPGAAAITSLARYTMRTAAQYEDDPTAMLRRLNATLGSDPERRQICTAVCVDVRPPADGATGVGLQVVCAGHPSPLLVAADGSVRPVGRPGTLLGAFAEGRWTVADVALGVGDALVLYTDGVTDTRGPDGPLRHRAPGGAAARDRSDRRRDDRRRDRRGAAGVRRAARRRRGPGAVGHGAGRAADGCRGRRAGRSRGLRPGPASRIRPERAACSRARR